VTLVCDKSKGCVPFCSAFHTISGNLSYGLVSKWYLNSSGPYQGKTFCVSDPGTYTLSVAVTDTASTSSCWANLSQIVVGYERPEAGMHVSPINIYENDGDVSFTSTSTGHDLTQWNWSFNSELGGSYARTLKGESVSNRFSDAGIYVVALEVRNRLNCSDTIMQKILVEEEFLSWVPNCFTPNEDLLNDDFRPIIRGAKNFSFEIYDRWGALMYKNTNDPDNGWDGTYRGEQVKEDEYTWVITASSMSGESKSLSGHVVLVR
jgi:gliding motility-associated-like protein